MLIFIYLKMTARHGLDYRDIRMYFVKILTKMLQ